ncbi:dysbindin protein homolog isoform X2 [Watersipora subatra]|uniref:dysbindin protein homolog isoform X2 n=1 Tax=Watersipora subatra TaxID=2589382 RepID=UPI00355B6150
MFKSLRSKLSSVKDNLTTGYEVSWEELFRVSQENLWKAKAATKDLHLVENVVSSCELKLEEVEMEVKQLPNILSSIQQISDQIVDLHSLCSLVEDGLAVLENLCDSTDAMKARQEEEEKLATYKASQQQFVVEYSNRLAAEHKKKIIAVEMREAEVRREKELFYQKAFEEDLRRFKAEQKLVEAQASLEEMTIEPDMQERQNLEAFLNDGIVIEVPVAKTENPLPTNEGQLVSSPHSDQVSDTSSNNLDISRSAEELQPISSDLRPHSESDSSLEWDYREDDLKIGSAERLEQLESSLEKEINGILNERDVDPLLVGSTDAIYKLSSDTGS